MQETCGWGEVDWLVIIIVIVSCTFSGQKYNYPLVYLICQREVKILVYKHSVSGIYAQSSIQKVTINTSIPQDQGGIILKAANEHTFWFKLQK